MYEDFKPNFIEESLLSIDINSLLDPIYFENYQNAINGNSLYESLFKEHRWQNFIFSTNPIRVDNITLLKNPDICVDLAKAINYYHQTLSRLIQYRINEGESYDQEKWNSGVEKLKGLLYVQVKELIDQVPNSSMPSELKDYIDDCVSKGISIDKNYLNSFEIPKNVLNNYIYNSTKRLSNKSFQQIDKIQIKINNETN